MGQGTIIRRTFPCGYGAVPESASPPGLRREKPEGKDTGGGGPKRAGRYAVKRVDCMTGDKTFGQAG